MEDLEIKIGQQLYTLLPSKLEELGEFLKVNIRDQPEKGRRYKVKKLREGFETMVEEYDEENLKKFLEDVWRIVSEENSDADESPVVGEKETSISQGNGQTERFNQTLLSMLRTLPEDKKSHWKDHVNKVVHAYNCTPNDSTGFSPFYLLYGRSPRLPVDLILGTEKQGQPTVHREYVKRWQTAMQEAYSMALEKAQQSNARGAKHYNRRLNFTELQAGDRVLVRNLTPRGGPGKLRSYWEDAVHVVMNRKGIGPVYEIQREDGGGKARVLHRNLLLPCEFLQPANQRPHVRATRRPRPRQQQQQQSIAQEDPTQSDSESDDDLIRVTRQAAPVGGEEVEQDLESVVDSEGDSSTSEMSVSDADNIDNADISSTEETTVTQQDQQPTITPQPREQESRYPRRTRAPPARLGYDGHSNPVLLQAVQHQPYNYYGYQGSPTSPWYPWVLAPINYRTPVYGVYGQY